jgi:hypothetical protein
MYCSIILWNLSVSTQTVASLRRYLRDEAVDAYAKVEGLRQKVWVSSTGPEGEIWGGVYLWDTLEAAYGGAPSVSSAMKLIGYMPTRRTYFSVEAATEGVSAVGALAAGLGLAYADPAGGTGEPVPLSRPPEYAYPGMEAPPEDVLGKAPPGSGASNDPTVSGRPTKSSEQA